MRVPFGPVFSFAFRTTGANGVVGAATSVGYEIIGGDGSPIVTDVPINVSGNTYACVIDSTNLTIGLFYSIYAFWTIGGQIYTVHLGEFEITVADVIPGLPSVNMQAIAAGNETAVGGLATIGQNQADNNVMGDVAQVIGSVGGNVTGNVLGSVGSIGFGGIINNSFAANSGLRPLRGATFVAGICTATTLTIPTGATLTQQWRGNLISIWFDTGISHSAIITDYNVATGVITFAPALPGVVSGSGTYAISPNRSDQLIPPTTWPAGSGGNAADAPYLRAAIGLALANLDTQLTDILAASGGIGDMVIEPAGGVGEPEYTLTDAIRLILAQAVGLTNRHTQDGDLVVNFRDVNNRITRVSMKLDRFNDRTEVTKDVTDP